MNEKQEISKEVFLKLVDSRYVFNDNRLLQVSEDDDDKPIVDYAMDGDREQAAYLPLFSNEDLNKAKFYLVFNTNEIEVTGVYTNTVNLFALTKCNWKPVDPSERKVACWPEENQNEH